jgi:chromosome segregation ATPase
MRTAEELQDELTRSEKARGELLDKYTAKADEIGNLRASEQRERDRADAAERSLAKATADTAALTEKLGAATAGLRDAVDTVNRQAGQLGALDTSLDKTKAELLAARDALSQAAAHYADEHAKAAAANATLAERLAQAQQQVKASADEAAKYRAAHDAKAALLSGILKACLDDAQKLQ